MVITAASVQDRDAARPLLWNMRRACRRTKLAWADSRYVGQLVIGAATALQLTVEIVRKRDRHAFGPLPRRWIVERTFAWISKHRRRARRVFAPVADCRVCADPVCSRHMVWCSERGGYVCTRCSRDPSHWA